MIVDEIRKLTEEENVPVLGFGPASEMAGELPGHRPEDVLPGAQSLICFGLPVPQGVYRTPTYTLETVWRSQNLNYRRLDTLSLQIATLLEENRARAVPIYGCQLVPLIRAVSPLLIPLGKLVETSFDFYYDEKCTGCGICEQVCLAEKVQMVDGKPVWQEVVKCHGCFACLNFCPEESIQVQSKWYLKSYTDQNGRYHHPQITARDITRQKRVVAS